MAEGPYPRTDVQLTVLGEEWPCTGAHTIVLLRFGNEQKTAAGRRWSENVTRAGTQTIITAVTKE